MNDENKNGNGHAEESNYEFIKKEFSKYLKCPACSELMKDPMRLHPCGHTFCNKCAPEKGNCLECKKKVKAVQRDLVGQSLVNEFEVRCLNEGCPFKGTFEDYKKYHSGTCKLKVGLDNWLKDMKSTLQEHADDGVKKRF